MLKRDKKSSIIIRNTAAKCQYLVHTSSMHFLQKSSRQAKDIGNSLVINFLVAYLVSRPIMNHF